LRMREDLGEQRPLFFGGPVLLCPLKLHSHALHVN
jgi:hypothetical protein